MNVFNINRVDGGFALSYFLQLDDLKTVEIALKAIPIPFLDSVVRVHPPPFR